MLFPHILKAEEPINLSVRGVELGGIAELLQRATDQDVLVPASAMRDRRDIKLENVAFADAVDQLGLVLRRRDDAAY